MALTPVQKQIAALVAKRNGDPDYMIRLSEDPAFAAGEIMSNLPAIVKDLMDEKLSHETHIQALSARLEKIQSLLSGIEEMMNGA